MNGATLRTLRAIDWDFALPRSGYVAPPHWYPGTFVPALSDALIEALVPEGGAVFDPYCGIGTTGWSAMRTGRSSHLADINPVAILVAYVTGSLLALKREDSAGATSALGAVSQSIGRNDDLYGASEAAGGPELDQRMSELCSPSPDEIIAKVVIGEPRWDLLRTWIAEETLADLATLVGNVTRSNSSYVRLLGLCMSSSIARNVSSQHASWGHIADNVRPRQMTAQNVHAATTRWLKRTKAFSEMAMVPGRGGASAPRPTVHVRNWSRAGSLSAGNCDLLLTSPPYADAIDYTLAQRLSLYILGYDDKAISGLVAGEIGARRKRGNKTSRPDWSHQLCTALVEQVTWLKPMSAVCLVLPHKDSGRSLGEEGMKATLEALGYRLFFKQNRSIHQSHTRQSWTSIKKETIFVFAAE